jgi:cell fate regulator YaaT (PSP1 superfamily)
LQVPETDPEVVGQDYEQMSNDQLTYLKRVELSDEHLLDDLGDHEFTDGEKIMDVVGVKLQPSGPITLFDCKNMSIERGDHVVVETGRGLALGEVLIPGQRKMVSHNDLPRVIRKASHSDRRQLMRNRDKEDAAYRLCKDRIEKLNLPMKLIEVEYLHGGNKAIFYFSADGRVDFRDLVRDLAQRLHTRIEMRQIGVRDVSRMLGGIGVCGCQLCCNLFLREFKPISIRMAKDQDLVLNPQKVSGNCGRLLCCLTYEDALYREAAKGMPKVGRRVITPDGEGRIRDRDVLKRIVRVQFNDDPILREYRMDDLKQAPKQKSFQDGESPANGSPEEPFTEEEAVELPVAEDLNGEP